MRVKNFTEKITTKYRKQMVLGIKILAEEYGMDTSKLIRHILGEYLRKKGVM